MNIKILAQNIVNNPNDFTAEQIEKYFEDYAKLCLSAVSCSHYSCMDCEWEGEVSECDFDTEYDEFKNIDRKYLVCPKCGGGLDC